MKLSEAILRGCEMTPKQAFGNVIIWTPEKATCALGAAIEGIGADPMKTAFRALFPAVRQSLQKNIECLNDDHRWSRERIAGWLAEKGL